MDLRSFSLLGVLVVAVHVLAPAPVRGAVDSAVVLACAGAGAVLVHRRGLHRTAWALLPVGALLMAAGDTAVLVAGVPALAPALWLAGYAALGAATWRLGRGGGRRAGGLLEDGLDLIVVVSSSGVMLIWLLSATSAGADPGAALRALSYVALDGLLLLAAGRVWRRGGRRQPAVRWLVAGVVLLLLADLFWGVAHAVGAYEPGSLFDAPYSLVALALVAAVASADRARAAAAARPPRPWVRVTALGAALFGGATAALLLQEPAAQQRAAAAALIGVAGVVGRIVVLWRSVDEARRQVLLTLHRAHDPYVAFSADGVVRSWNDAAARTFGHHPEDVLGRSIVELLPDTERDSVTAWLGALRAGSPAAGLGAPLGATVPHADGRELPVEVTVWTTRADGFVHLFLRDMSARLEHEELLRRQALHDPLTGLANRALLADRLELALAAMHREGGTVAVALVDLDDFKQVNDLHGHQRGDDLLRAVADRLRQHVRATDTVARYGGDEFAVVSPGLRGPEDAAVVARTLQEALAAAPAVRASVGVATACDAGSVTQLFACADLALYDAKRGGKGRWARYDPTLHAAHQRRIRIAADLPAAIAEEAIQVAFQPIVDAGTRDIVAVEALARWTHPELGRIPPPEFIGVAEEEHLVDALGAEVLRRACRVAAGLPEGNAGPIDVSVNVSAQQMGSDFPAIVADALRDADLAPERLVLELTETLLVGSLDAVVAVMQHIRATGVRFASAAIEA